MTIYRTINAIPRMTSNTSPNGVVSSSPFRSGFPPYMSFDGVVNDGYGWTTNDNVTVGWISYEFISPILIGRYTIMAHHSVPSISPKNWTFEGSNDDGATWDVLDIQSNHSWSTSQKKTFSFNTVTKYKRFRINITSSAGGSYLNINQVEMFEAYLEFVLIKHEDMYKKYGSSTWQIVTSITPTYQDYLSGISMDEMDLIPTSAWSQLQGEVELCYFTDDPTKTEASFNIETEPFTLAEEWEDKEIKIIEYTDDPNQTESTITIETEPFTLYDELGDSVDVLFYTDDPSKTSVELNITANYSPLDELEGDFDVVTWSDNNNPKVASTSAIPSPQSIIQTDDYYMYGDLLSIVDKLNSTNGTLRYSVSFNEGNTWEVCKFGKWRTIDISSFITFKRSGMSHYDISLIDSVALKNKGNKIRFAYYIEDNIHNPDPGIAIDSMKLNINSATETIKMDNVAFYVLNTNATIQLTLTGSKLIGILDDSDQGKVQYRILLNDKAYYPSDGSFTRLAPSPQDIDINISDRDIIFNQPNKLKVEFQDYWGETDYWETTFIGSYSGLMFMDESGEYLSDTFGGILKQLDFGVIIAGQTTLIQKVRLKNQLGYAIDNVYLEMDKKYERDGVVVQLSRQANPFLPIDYLTYGLTQPDETIDFYVRIATDMRAQPNPNGLFELVVNADRV
ncbi:discoidin domain-containing protein [Paenibacillus sp. USHLN196]|uniref:discoidin domain-containing protein n=1 Tax=Paenibacillus sp. USHLN196 TaxID=3081291 RepID=UPI003017B3A7